VSELATYAAIVLKSAEDVPRVRRIIRKDGDAADREDLTIALK